MQHHYNFQNARRLISFGNNIAPVKQINYKFKYKVFIIIANNRVVKELRTITSIIACIELRKAVAPLLALSFAVEFLDIRSMLGIWFILPRSPCKYVSSE